MSERTTIGGTVYESIGSSSSNLLLKCNGTARIQWGNKLIDLIKNGKIAAGDSSGQVSIISDESDIKSDGIYVIDKEERPQLWVCKNGEHYNLTGTDLYISASTKQTITAEQQKQALENIGIYYNTLQDVENAGIQNGLVYVIEDRNLYTITNGVISEFEAKLKTVTVEQEDEQGEVINSSIQVVLSISDSQYLVIRDRQIVANYDLCVKDSAMIMSEGADSYRGYRLYMDGGASCLDVDKINVREGIPIKEYEEVTYEALTSLITSKTLKPHTWYLLTNYQNPWKLPLNIEAYNRPILIRALTTSTFYTEGQLFKDRRVTIHYDPTYSIGITILNDDGTPGETSVSTRGLITWMKDSQNNEANFDFLDYSQGYDKPLSTLHESIEDTSLDMSIFPKYSHDNKLTVYDLKGTVFTDEGLLDEVNVNTVDFQIEDTKNIEDMEEGEILPTMVMYGNIIECRGLTVTSTCSSLCNNTLTQVSKLIITTDCNSNNLKSVYTTSNGEPITSFEGVSENSIFINTQINSKLLDVSIDALINSSINSDISNTTLGKVIKTTINNSITGSSFGNIEGCTFNCDFTKSKFRNLTNCTFGEGTLHEVNCNSDISNLNITSTDYPLLYDTSKAKEVYYGGGVLQITCTAEQSFARGMIVMHYGKTAIPEGWAPCDGNTYIYDGVTSETPNLVNRFIKAVSNTSDVGEGNNPDLNTNNEFTLTEAHLPEHTHPHTTHKHTFEGSGSSNVEVTVNTLVNPTSKTAIVTVEGGTEGTVGDDVETGTVTGTGTVSMTISGETSEVTSEESPKTWENKAFKIEPNYYSLIFIMKL